MNLVTELELSAMLDDIEMIGDSQLSSDQIVVAVYGRMNDFFDNCVSNLTLDEMDEVENMLKAAVCESIQ